MTPTAAASLFYTTAGTMKPDAPSYVERAADRELHDRVKAGEFCFVLTSRQMGKSSLMQRTARDLKIEAVRVAVVDLTEMGTERGSDSWYYSFCETVHEQAAAAWPFSDWWKQEIALTPTRRLTKFLGELAGDSQQPLVIFVDEIDSTIKLPFSDDFFAAIRACHNARSRDTRFEKLTFVLLGVATPAQLIRDATRTPFNVGHEIALGDFTKQEAGRLGQLLSSKEARRLELLDRILSWTGGQPYLTQTLCKEIAVRRDGAAVDSVVEELFLKQGKLQSDSHLKQTADRLVQGGRPLMKLYQRVRVGRDVLHEPASPLHAQLMLTGVVKADERGRLRVRNRIYETVFGADWLRESMPRNNAIWIGGSAAVAALALLFGWQALNQQRAAEALLWEERARQAMVEGKRDHALVLWLKAATRKSSPAQLREASDLIGRDYPNLRLTLRDRDLRHAAFSADGEVAVIIKSGTTIQRRSTATADVLGGPLWQNTGRMELLPFEIKTYGNITLVNGVFSTLSEGALAVTRGWRTDTGAVAVGPIRNPTLRTTVALNETRKIVATGGDDGKVRFWRVDDGVSTGPILQHLGSVKSIEFSADGARVLVDSAVGFSDGDKDGEALQWHWETGQLIGRPFRYRKDQFIAVFSPDGKTIATGGASCASLWSVDTQEPTGQQFCHLSIVDSLAFGRDGSLFTGSRDGFSQQWNVRDGEPIGIPSFEPSVRTVVVGSDSATLTTTGGSLAERFTGIRRWSVSVAQPMGRRLPSGPAFDTSGKTTPVVPGSNSAWSMSADGQTVISGNSDGVIQRWNPKTRKLVSPPLRLNGSIRAIALSPDEKTILVGLGTEFAGRIQKLSADSGTKIEDLPSLYVDLKNVSFSPDGNSFVVGTSLFYYIYSSARPSQLVAVRHLPYPATELRFVPNCSTCLDAFIRYPGGRGEVIRLRWDLANVEPMRGDPDSLLGEWERRLGIRVASDGKIEPRYPLD